MSNTEILLFTDDVSEAKNEIERQGGRLTLQLSDRVLVAQFAPGGIPATFENAGPERPSDLDEKSEIAVAAWEQYQARSATQLLGKMIPTREKRLAKSGLVPVPEEEHVADKIEAKSAPVESLPMKDLEPKSKVEVDPNKTESKPETDRDPAKEVRKSSIAKDPNPSPIEEVPGKIAPKNPDGRFEVVPWDDSRYQTPLSSTSDADRGHLKASPPGFADTMTGSTAVGLLVVSGPGSYAISDSEYQNALSQTLTGTNFLASADPSAKASFAYDQHFITVDVAPGSFTIWQTSLPGCGYNITSVITAGGFLFAGSNGFVYKQNATTGQVLNTNNLSGRGYNEVRLAADASHIYVGTNGYVLALNQSDLSTAWQTSLPGCGYGITSVVTDGTAVYAGCNGNVYRLNPSNGDVWNRNSLPGRGTTEVRLSLGAGKLFVGTNGYALGLNTNDIGTAWQTSLPGCGYTIVSVLFGNNVLYAGSNGYVYRLDTSSGSVLNTNGLSGMGNHEIRLAADGSYLYVGTNGFALGLSPSDLGTQWQTTLPGCGYGITEMLTLGYGYIFAGCNGYIYELWNNGTVIFTNSLSGLGLQEVRLTQDQSGNVYAGTNGYSLQEAVGDPYAIMARPWQDAALQQLGYPGGQVGCQQYANAIRTSLGTDWTYVGFITKYPLQHFGYQTGVTVVMNYDNDGWGPGQIGNVFAHETGHVFGALDEYASACTCGQLGGKYNVPNNNCANCPGTQESCIMAANDFQVCQWSRGQFGWDYCTTMFQTSLPGCGYGVTSVVTDGTYVYAGCNGYVYKLNPATGQVLNTNSLSGRGNQEIRLAIQGGTLFVGTNGYAIGIETGGLTTLWQTSLPGCGYNIVSMLWGNGSLYAGSNGYVYRLDPVGGSVQATNSLSGMGYNEIRLAANGQALYVGTNGYALRLDPNNLSTQAQVSLPGCGYGLTSVTTGSGSVYAGCNGYVYRLDPTSLSVQNTNSLPGMGNHETRLAVGNTHLFVGINGYTLGLLLTDISTSWQTSLPGCGYAVTDVIVDNGYPFAGCNGYVYKLDPTYGTVLYVNSLPGLGHAEVRLCPAVNAVYGGTNGYAFGINVYQGAVPVPPGAQVEERVYSGNAG